MKSGVKLQLFGSLINGEVNIMDFGLLRLIASVAKLERYLILSCESCFLGGVR